MKVIIILRNHLSAYYCLETKVCFHNETAGAIQNEREILRINLGTKVELKVDSYTSVSGICFTFSFMNVEA